MKKQPLISVVMGVYNAQSCINRAVESILGQTWRNFEFIIIDDGSTDGTGELLQQYAADDPRIRLLSQSNQGLTRSLRQGCQLAAGEYLARQDADDLSRCDRLELQVEKLEANPDAALCTSWVEDVAPDGMSIQIHRDLNHCIEVDGKTIPLVGIPAHGSVTMRKSCYDSAGGYRTEFYYAQDSDLWLRMYSRGSFEYVGEPLYKRFLSTQSISSTRAMAQSRFCQLAQESYRARLRGNSDVAILSQAEALAQRCRQERGTSASRYVRATALLLIAAQVRTRNKSKAIQYLKEAISICPYHARAWKALLQTLANSYRR